MDRHQARTAQIRGALIVGGLLIGAAYLLKRLSPSVLSPEVAERTLGALMGGVLVAYANAIPKTPQRDIAVACRTDEQHASRRFAGWMLVLGGAGYVLIWIFAPIRVAGVASTATLATALAVVLARLFWRAPRPRNP